MQGLRQTSNYELLGSLKNVLVRKRKLKARKW